MTCEWGCTRRWSRIWLRQFRLSVLTAVRKWIILPDRGSDVGGGSSCTSPYLGFMILSWLRLRCVPNHRRNSTRQLTLSALGGIHQERYESANQIPCSKEHTFLTNLWISVRSILVHNWSDFSCLQRRNPIVKHDIRCHDRKRHWRALYNLWNGKIRHLLANNNSSSWSSSHVNAFHCRKDVFLEFVSGVFVFGWSDSSVCDFRFLVTCAVLFFREICSDSVYFCRRDRGDNTVSCRSGAFCFSASISNRQRCALSSTVHLSITVAQKNTRYYWESVTRCSAP